MRERIVTDRATSRGRRKKRKRKNAWKFCLGYISPYMYLFIRHTKKLGEALWALTAFIPLSLSLSLHTRSQKTLFVPSDLSLSRALSSSEFPPSVHRTNLPWVSDPFHLHLLPCAHRRKRFPDNKYTRMQIKLSLGLGVCVGTRCGH